MTAVHPLDAEIGDDYCLWLASVLPGPFKARMAPHHDEFWRWVWSIQLGEPVPPFIAAWARGGAKSTSAEAAVVAVGARQTRRYVLVVCDTQERADDHVANAIGTMLESERVQILYPELAEKKIALHGNSRGWRHNRLWTAAGLIVDAVGLDKAVRGIKLEDQRPDMIVLDDIDGRFDTTATTTKKIATLTEGVLPAGSDDCAVLGIQNLIHRDSVFARLVDGRAEFLSDRIVSGPIPALRNMRVLPDGSVDGEPTWEGQSVEACNRQVRRFSLPAFRREAQHEVAEAEGALWSRPQIGAMRRDGTPDGPLTVPPESWKKAVIMVDPSGGDGPDNDEVGVIGSCRGYDDLGYVVGDWSGRLPPEAWGRLAVIKAVDTGFMAVGGEPNYGGAMVVSTVRNAIESLAAEGMVEARAVTVLDPAKFRATTGKRQRAEPVAAMCGEPDDEASWRRGVWRLCGDFPLLEDELTGWVPDVSKTSPNRADAFWWTAHYLFPERMGTAAPRRPTRAAVRRHGSVYG